jgi:hypothetical protein
MEGIVIASALGVKWPKDEHFTGAQSMSQLMYYMHTQNTNLGLSSQV